MCVVATKSAVHIVPFILVLISSGVELDCIHAARRQTYSYRKQSTGPDSSAQGTERYRDLHIELWSFLNGLGCDLYYHGRFKTTIARLRHTTLWHKTSDWLVKTIFIPRNLSTH